MGTNTPNYNLFLPDGSDSMSDVKKNLTDNFKKIEPRADPTIIAAGGALPQSGEYEVGDRVFRDDPVTGTTWPSSYILVCKDANWGWHWRPVQQIISPWVTVPDSALADAINWEFNPTYPLQIALDSRGYVMWRGVVQSVTDGFDENTTFIILKEIPEGISPNYTIMHTCAISPLQGGAGEAGAVLGRIYVNPEFGYNSFRAWNTDNGTSKRFWLTGLTYAGGTHWFYNA